MWGTSDCDRLAQEIFLVSALKNSPGNARIPSGNNIKKQIKVVKADTG